MVSSCSRALLSEPPLAYLAVVFQTRIANRLVIKALAIKEQQAEATRLGCVGGLGPVLAFLVRAVLKEAAVLLALRLFRLSGCPVR